MVTRVLELKNIVAALIVIVAGCHGPNAAPDLVPRVATNATAQATSPVCTAKFFPVDKDVEIRAIGATGPNDAWAVGSVQNQSYASVIEHFNGVSFTRVRSPNVTLPLSVYVNSTFESVLALAPNNAWAVGGAYGGSSYSNVNAPMAAHWDGTSWRLTTVAPKTPSGTVLHAVDGDATNDVWAVGTSPGGQIVLEQWDEGPWRLIVTASASQSISAMRVLSRTNVWLAGSNNGVPALWHWDGQSLRIWPIRLLPLGATGALNSIMASGPTDIWAAGATHTSAWEPLVVHFDGLNWSRYAVASSGADEEFTGIAEFAANYVIAVGNIPNPIWADPLIAVYNGYIRWHTIPTNLESFTLIYSASRIPGTATSIWSIEVQPYLPELFHAAQIVCPSRPPA